MRIATIIVSALAALAANTSAHAHKDGYPQKPQHCTMVKVCHKNTDFPCANNASPDLPICKKPVCTMVKTCD